MKTLEEVKAKALAFIADNGAESTDEAAFNELALAIFRFQFEHNRVYRAYCRKLRVSPLQVEHYHSIPPVPITAYKESVLSCFPIEEAEAVFMTSGTTRPAHRGRQYHRDLQVWRQSMARAFNEHVLREQERARMLILFPSAKELPNSSLAHYLDHAVALHGSKDSVHVMTEEGLDTARLVSLLNQAEVQEPLMLLGATFSYVHLVDYCQAQGGLRLPLPPGSTVLDTGGTKGRSREVATDEFRASLQEVFGTEGVRYVNMYGMTEISSQCYSAGGEDVLETPHWMRSFTIDPITRKVVTPGSRGILVHVDLANIHSSIAVMTEDVGISSPGHRGFHMLGRAEGAEAKGCSLAVDEFIAASGGADG